MKYLFSQKVLHAIYVNTLLILLSLNTCLAEGGGGGGGVGGNGASGPEPQSWLFIILGFSVLAGVAFLRKLKNRPQLEH